MTSAITFPAWVIGLMSGTSMDGVDAALLYTDGEHIARPGASLTLHYDEELRRSTLALMKGMGDKAAIAHALTLRHYEAVEALIQQSGLPRAEIKLIGFHGQTIRHAPHEGITEQIGDAAWLAAETGIPVVADFRSNDVRHGGQGAPLVPLYHAALAHALPKPVMVVNIGGVANVTWIGEKEESRVESRELSGKEARFTHLASPTSSLLDSRLSTLDSSLLAFDCGPGNALIDDWMRRHTGAAHDEGGAVAARGRVDKARVAAFLRDEFFARPAPKSLDRHHFSLDLVAGLSLEDGAATLTAMTAAAIAASVKQVPAPPLQWLITGGGRHNQTLMRMIGERVAGGGWQVVGEIETVEGFVRSTLKNPDSPPEGEPKRSFSVSVGGNPERNPPTEPAALRSQVPAPPQRGSKKERRNYDKDQGNDDEAKLHGSSDYLIIDSSRLVAPVESVGWNGDALEAEAFAYLAVRSAKKLPLTLASTTGVSQPVTGGVFYPVSGAGGS
jgi:anhydro-N-acetylmuramic acid kinase